MAKTKMSPEVRQKLRDAANAKAEATRGRGPIQSYDAYGFSACVDEILDPTVQATRDVLPVLIGCDVLRDWQYTLRRTARPTRELTPRGPVAEEHLHRAQMEKFATSAPVGPRLRCDSLRIRYHFWTAKAERTNSPQHGQPGPRGDRVAWAMLKRWPQDKIDLLRAACPASKIVRCGVYAGPTRGKIEVEAVAFPVTWIVPLFGLLWPLTPHNNSLESVSGHEYLSRRVMGADRLTLPEESAESGRNWRWDATAFLRSCRLYLTGFTDLMVANREVK